MNIMENAEMIAIIGTVTPVIVSILKRIFGNKYQREFAMAVPAVFAIGVAVFTQYAPEAIIAEAVKTGGMAYALAQGIYKVQK